MLIRAQLNLTTSHNVNSQEVYCNTEGADIARNLGDQNDGSGGCAMYGVVQGQLSRWVGGMEYRCCEGSGLCDGLITGLEEVGAWVLCVVWVAVRVTG